MICFNPKEIIDISMPLVEGMKVYKGREAKKPRFENQVNHQTGTVHESLLSMNLHTGTHIDTKLHMIDDGERLEALAISDFIAPAIVLDFSHIQNAITKTDIEEKIASLAKKNILKKGSVTTILKEHFVILKTKIPLKIFLKELYLLTRGWCRIFGKDGLARSWHRCTGDRARPAKSWKPPCAHGRGHSYS